MTEMPGHRSRAGGPGHAAAFPWHRGGSGANSPPVRHVGDRHGGHDPMRQGARPQGARGEIELGAPGDDALAGHSGAQGRRLPALGQGRRRQGGGAIPEIAAAGIDDQGRARGGLGWPHRPDDPARQLDGTLAPLRYHMVPGRDSQVSAAAGRGAARLVLPAAVRAGLATLLSGGDRQLIAASTRSMC